MKVFSESDIIHAVQHEMDVEFPNRKAYEEGRKFILDFAEYCAENQQWEWFGHVQRQVDKMDKDWAPPGGWTPLEKPVVMEIER